MKRKFLLLIAINVTLSLTMSCGDKDKIDLFPLKSGDNFQFIDREGEVAFHQKFSYATILRDGLAMVKTSGVNPKWGFIDEKGDYKISALYKEATVFSDGLAIVVLENGAPQIIDKSGKVKATLTQSEKVRWFKEGLAAFSVANDTHGEKWGFVNKEGAEVIAPEYLAVMDFRNNLSGVKNSSGKWGFINVEGEFVIKPKFENVKRFKNGKCIVSSGGKTGIINKDGKYLVEPQFDDMVMDNDIYLVKIDSKWGWCDENGNLLIAPKFKDAFPFFQNDKTAVKTGEMYGYINKEGELVISPQFDFAIPFNNKLALVSRENLIGFINSDGKFSIDPQYEGLSIDLVEYLYSGESVYTTVNTDYYNLDKTSRRIKK